MVRLASACRLFFCSVFFGSLGSAFFFIAEVGGWLVWSHFWSFKLEFCRYFLVSVLKKVSALAPTPPRGGP